MVFGADSENALPRARQLSPIRSGHTKASSPLQCLNKPVRQIRLPFLRQP